MLRPRRLASCDLRGEWARVSVPTTLVDADVRANVPRARWAGRGGASVGVGSEVHPRPRPTPSCCCCCCCCCRCRLTESHTFPLSDFLAGPKDSGRRLLFFGEKASEPARKHSGPRIARKPYCSRKAEIPPSALAQLDRRFDHPTDRRTDRRMGAQHSTAATHSVAHRSDYPLSPLPRLGSALGLLGRRVFDSSVAARTQESVAEAAAALSSTQQHPARNSPTLSPLSRRPHTLPEERKSDAIRVRLSTSSFHLHPIPIPIHTPPASSSSSPPTPRVSSTTSADLNPSASSRLITNAASPCFRLACPPIHRRRAALPLARSCGPPHLRPAHAVSVYLATPPNLQHMHFRFS